MKTINPALMKKALLLARDGKCAGYERLEFLGDRVVGLIAADIIYKKFPKEKEGPMAKRFTSLTREETLAQIAEQLGIPKMLNTKEEAMRHNASILSDVMEAIIAAFYLDKGLAAAYRFFEPLILPFLDEEIPEDPKSALQELTLKKYKELPQYKTEECIGPAHQPIYTVSVQIKNKKALGKGTSKKNAEKEAATRLLEDLKNGH